MTNCIIGYTGTVGKNLVKQGKFSYFFNSKNIKKIHKNSYNLTFVCAPHAKKWWANKFPKKDDYITNKLIKNLSNLKTKKIILISTIDVYNVEAMANENSPISIDKLNIYGKNRYKIEKFVENSFNNYFIIRLPAIYGNYLKKNIIFDLMNNNNLNQIRLKSSFQWYFIGNLMKDIKKIINKKIRKINLFTEPIPTSELVNLFFKEKKKYLDQKNSGKNYNLKTIHYKVFKGKMGYIMNKKNNFKILKNFFKNEIVNF